MVLDAVTRRDMCCTRLGGIKNQFIQDVATHTGQGFASYSYKIGDVGRESLSSLALVDCHSTVDRTSVLNIEAVFMFLLIPHIALGAGMGRRETTYSSWSKCIEGSSRNHIV